jgi:hypothetical protein
MRAFLRSFIWTFTLMMTLAFAYSTKPIIKPTYNGVDARAKRLVNEFKDLAKERGISFKKEIPVGFTKINNGTIVGLCTYGYGWRQITIDEGYFAAINVDEQLSLVFHELTHCYCGRDHDYDKGTKYPPTEELRIVEAKEWQKRGGPKPGRFEDACPSSLMYPIVVESACIRAHYDQYVEEMFNRCKPY